MPDRAASYFLAICLVLLIAPAAAARQERSIDFANKTWKIAVNPGTLEVTATPTGSKQRLVLSAGQPETQTISKLQASPSQARWDLTEKGIAVSMRLEGDTLAVDFTAREAGEFTWPILPPQPANRAYILPLGEGAYVPNHDAEWGDYLVKQEGISTTEGLSMPLWGIDAGAQTLTYILTNPFNNELAFNRSAGSLEARLTHRFTRNNAVKTYGVRITLGPSSPIEPAKQYRRWLIHTGHFVGMKEKIRRVPEAAKLLGAAHVYLWGDGVSPKMMEALHSSGFDRLWLGSPGWNEMLDNPAGVAKAKSLGYLIGPYDSYDSVHSPDAKPDDTWETAQFDQHLYDTGGIVLASGKKKSGFQGKGYYVNARAAWPYVRPRVERLMKAFQCNSWFIDCDAAGEFFDDFSPLHPATQKQEMQERLRRMAWIRDTYHLVIGSEGGAAYSAGTIHFAHGMMTKPFGWGDADLKDKDSRYYLGAYYPPEAPATFFKPVPLKPSYYRFLFDSRFRLPLYETVFHDSVIATHHWTTPTLKFSDQVVERSLLEQLYNVPPLYHLNTREFARRKTWMQAQYAFFSPLHKKAALLPLTGFAWLTPERTVQRTVFGDLEIVANFSQRFFKYRGHQVPPKSVIALDRNGRRISTYTPKAES